MTGERKRRGLMIALVIALAAVAIVAAAAYLPRRHRARVAHPDDLEFYAGGTAISLAKHNKVIVLMGTLGDKGAGGWPCVAAVRKRLQLETAKIAGYSDVVFLRHPDQGLGEASAYPGEVQAAFERYKPTIVLTFDAADEAQGYRHVDHEAAGRTAAAVAMELGGVTLYLFSSSAGRDRRLRPGRQD